MIARVAIPSRGRLRGFALELLNQAGFTTSFFDGHGSRAIVNELEFIEMRPRDAAAWLGTGRINGAFISTDLVLEEDLGHLVALPLGSAQSDLVIASREGDGRTSAADLTGAIVATHLPKATTRWFNEQQIKVTVVTMGGALEGVCSAGLADAIVDIRETGNSLAKNGLRTLEEIIPCQGLFVYRSNEGLENLELRIRAVLDARKHYYLMFHLEPTLVGQLAELFLGLTAPTVLPLAAREDIVAVHIVVEAKEFWSRLQDLRTLGATDIVALPPNAILR